MKISDIDQVLLRYADSRSPAELSLLISSALTPEECAARVTMLLEKTDWLTMTQQDALVTLKMRQLISELEDQPRSTRNAEVLIRALEVLGNRLEKRSSGIEADLTRLYSWQSQLLLEALGLIIEHVKNRVPELNAVEESHWNEVAEEGLRRAGALLANHEDRSSVPVITSVPATPKTTSTASPAAAALVAKSGAKDGW